MAEHTPTPWRVLGTYSIAQDMNDPFVESWKIELARCGRRDNFRPHENAANARRIVACVNACEGIPTKELENGVVMMPVRPDYIEKERPKIEAVAALVEAAIRAQEFIVENHTTQVNERAFRVVDDLLKALAPFEAAGN